MLYDMKNESYWSGKRFALTDSKSNNIESSSIPFINGKVCAEFTLNTVECFTTDYRRDVEQTTRILEKACSNCVDAMEYEENRPCLYAWHIDNLKIYDKPKELREFGQRCEYASEIHCRDCSIRESWNDCCKVMIKPLKRPPQSWCYVEEIK